MKRNVILITALMMLALALCLAACQNTGTAGEETGTSTGTADSTTAADGTTPSDGTTETTAASAGQVTLPAPEESDETTGSAGEEETDAPTADTITPKDPANVALNFNGRACYASDLSAIGVSETAFLITKAGTYEIWGNATQQVRVTLDKTEDVTLIFYGFTGTSSTSAPLYIESCNKVNIVLAEGTVNTFTDAATYVYPDPQTDKPNACIYSSDDMDIEGDGTLIVNANYNNGIGCKNDLKIEGGTITVTAPNNALKGNDSVTVEGGNITLTGSEDGIKCDAVDRQDKGFILVQAGAVINITCSDDALQATVSVTVESGALVTVNAGGDTVNCDGTVNVAQGSVVTPE